MAALDRPHQDAADRAFALGRAVRRLSMPKRILTGTVVSDKGDKTVVVTVERKVQHPMYGQIIRRSTKYPAHHADNANKAGETYRPEEKQPNPKEKNWKRPQKVQTHSNQTT